MVDSSAAQGIRSDLRIFADPNRAAALMKFFKTASGQYGEGDVFIGITVPQCRQIAKKYRLNTDLADIKNLICSQFHEERLVALLLLIDKFAKAKSEQERRLVADFYLAVKDRINNWDLVDISAPRILGAYLFGKKDRSILYSLAESNVVWDRRIAMLSTLYFIAKHDFTDALKIVKILLQSEHKHDLIDKAMGWMLREIGKRDVQLEERFIQDNYDILPRTTLRYAIERFSRQKRLAYLAGLK